MRAIKVQKGVPIPIVKPRGRQGRSDPKYPWAKMDVGDSFLLPTGISPSSFWLLARNASKDGRLFKVYKTADGYRCWRIE